MEPFRFRGAWRGGWAIGSRPMAAGHSRLAAAGHSRPAWGGAPWRVRQRLARARANVSRARPARPTPGPGRCPYLRPGDQQGRPWRQPDQAAPLYQKRAPASSREVRARSFWDRPGEVPRGDQAVRRWQEGDAPRTRRRRQSAPIVGPRTDPRTPAGAAPPNARRNPWATLNAFHLRAPADADVVIPIPIPYRFRRNPNGHQGRSAKWYHTIG
eukprot:gene16026-biopygen10983